MYPLLFNGFLFEIIECVLFSLASNKMSEENAKPLIELFVKAAPSDREDKGIKIINF